MAEGRVLPAQAAAELIRSGQTVMVGGFGLVGSPLTIIQALADHGAATGLRLISNNVGEPGLGLGRLLLDGRVAAVTGSYFTSNPDVVAAHAEGLLEVNVLPQGTMAEAIRAGGAGIGGFYVTTGVGTALYAGSELREIDGVEHVFQPALKADVALVRASKADEAGNLVYHRTARNFNPEMATAADLVIAEVDEIVPMGGLDPEAIVTPRLFVDHIVVSEIGITDVKQVA